MIYDLKNTLKFKGTLKRRLREERLVNTSRKWRIEEKDSKLRSLFMCGNELGSPFVEKIHN